MRYGIKSVTMDDISRELGISKKTLYQHVDNKAELIQKVIHQHATAELEAMEDYSEKMQKMPLMRCWEFPNTLRRCFGRFLQRHSMTCKNIIGRPGK